MGAQRPAHPRAPSAERGEPSGAEWTQQHYQRAASSGHTTGTRRAPTGTGTRRAATGPRLTHCIGAATDTRRERPQAREEHMATGTPRAREEQHAAGAQGGTQCHGHTGRHGHARGPGRARHRRPGGNASPRAPAPGRDLHATGAQGGTQCHGHPARYRTSTPQDEHATGTRETRALPLAERRPNCARCVAWSG